MNFQYFYKQYDPIRSVLLSYVSMTELVHNISLSLMPGNFTLQKIAPFICIGLHCAELIENIKYADSLSKIIIAQLPDEETPSVIKVAATPNILSIMSNALGLLGNCMLLKNVFVDIIKDRVCETKATPFITLSFILGVISKISCIIQYKYTFINANTGFPVDIDENAEILKIYHNIKLDNNIYQYDYILVDVKTGEEFYYRVGDPIEYHDDGSLCIISPELIDATAIPSA